MALALPERADSSEGSAHGEKASGGLRRAWTSEEAQEAARKSAEVRRERAQEREELARMDALTTRQRIAVAIQRKYTVTEWMRILDGLKTEKPSAEVRALTQLMNQALGAPPEAEEDVAKDLSLADLTREQRAVVREALMSFEEEAKEE